MGRVPAPLTLSQHRGHTQEVSACTPSVRPAAAAPCALSSSSPQHNTHKAPFSSSISGPVRLRGRPLESREKRRICECRGSPPSLARAPPRRPRSRPPSIWANVRKKIDVISRHPARRPSVYPTSARVFLPVAQLQPRVASTSEPLPLHRRSLSSPFVRLGGTRGRREREREGARRKGSNKKVEHSSPAEVGRGGRKKKDMVLLL